MEPLFLNVKLKGMVSTLTKEAQGPVVHQPAMPKCTFCIKTCHERQGGQNIHNWHEIRLQTILWKVLCHKSIFLLTLCVAITLEGHVRIFGPPGKKERKSDCGEWQWSVCVANEGDCGLGTREGTRTGTDCKQTIKTQRCKIPCNWKKKFGGQGQTVQTYIS